MRSKTTLCLRLYPRLGQNRKWFQPRSYILRCNLKVRMKWDLTRNVGSDQSFNVLCESHLQSQLRSWLSAQNAEMALTINNPSEDSFHPDDQIPLSYEQVTDRKLLIGLSRCLLMSWLDRVISLLLVIRQSFANRSIWCELNWCSCKHRRSIVQSNLDYPDFSITRTFSLVPICSWIFQY